MAVLKPLGGEHGGGDYYLWKYLPSVPAAAIFAVLYALVTAGFVWRIVKTRTWFCIPFVIGGFLQVVGYIFRILARERTDELGPYIGQSTTILIAPVFYAASIYMTLGRIITSIGADKHAIIRPTRLTKIFLTADILALVVQAGGAGLMAKGGDMSKTAEGIVIGGLMIQIIAFGLFWATSVMFNMRVSRDVYMASQLPTNIPWQAMLWMLYIVSALIMGRSIFRVIEFAMGMDAYLLSTEWPLYVLDAGPMFLVMCVYLYWYPSALNPEKRWSSVPSSGEITVAEQGLMEMAPRRKYGDERDRY